MILENVSLAAPNSLRLAFAHLLLRPSRGNLVLGETEKPLLQLTPVYRSVRSLFMWFSRASNLF